MEHTPAYVPLSSSRANEHLLGKERAGDDDSELDSETLLADPLRRRCSGWILVLITALLASNAFLVVAYSLKRPSDHECNARLNVWSPINDAVEYEELDFDNAFAHDTVYRGPPTMELEYAWAKLWMYEGVRIPEDKLPFLNRTVHLGGGRTLKPVEDGEGDYHGLIEVFHQLHCLNMIRQYTWRDWYFRHPDIVSVPGSLAIDNVTARMHADHCIEALRLSLMCHAETTPSLVILDPDAPQGKRADFSAHHKCRKFEKIRQWTEENQLSEPKGQFLPPKSAGHDGKQA